MTWQPVGCEGLFTLLFGDVVLRFCRLFGCDHFAVLHGRGDPVAGVLPPAFTTLDQRVLWLAGNSDAVVDGEAKSHVRIGCLTTPVSACNFDYDGGPCQPAMFLVNRAVYR